MARRVLLTGATGLIGCHTAAALAREGFAVRALVRDEAKLARVLAPLGVDLARDGVEPARGDVEDPASIARAAAGCDAAIHCAGRFSHELADAAALRAVNVDGTRHVLDAALDAGLDPVVHVSSFLALMPSPGPRTTADDPIAPVRGMYSRTKADADRIARERQARGAPVAIVYPASVQGPHDPTVGSGPAVFAGYLRTGRVLVTRGGLGFTDVRDLALLLARLLAPGRGPRRLLAPTDFVEHERFHRLLCELTGRALAADRVPPALLRVLGRVGDLRQRLTGRPVPLTSEAATVLTRSAPFDDAEGRALLGRDATPAADSFRDLLRWMWEAGVLDAEHVGALASGPAPAAAPRP